MSYTDNDFRLYHSWGKKPEQKAREREYNDALSARAKVPFGNYDEHQTAKAATKKAEKNMIRSDFMVNEVGKEYMKTPLERVEYAVDKGKQFLRNLKTVLGTVEIHRRKR